MNQQDKDLLFKALCGYLPWKVKIILLSDRKDWIPKGSQTTLRPEYISNVDDKNLMLILRPLSDYTGGKLIGQIREELGITHDQTIEFKDFLEEERGVQQLSLGLLEGLQRNHIDYLGLIDKDLAVSKHDVNK